MENQHIKVRLFGLLVDLLQSESLELPMVQDTGDLLLILVSKFPVLQNQSFVLTADRRIVQSVMKINQTTELALLPPFSGG